MNEKLESINLKDIRLLRVGTLITFLEGNSLKTIIKVTPSYQYWRESIFIYVDSGYSMKESELQKVKIICISLPVKYDRYNKEDMKTTTNSEGIKTDNDNLFGVYKIS